MKNTKTLFQAFAVAAGGFSVSLYASKFLKQERSQKWAAVGDSHKTLLSSVGLGFGIDLLQASAFSKDHSAEELTLKQVQIVVRHGARTPFKLIPNVDPAVWDEHIWMRDLEHTMIPYRVRTADGGSKPESPMESAYRKRSRLKVCNF